MREGFWWEVEHASEVRSDPTGRYYLVRYGEWRLYRMEREPQLVATGEEAFRHARELGLGDRVDA